MATQTPRLMARNGVIEIPASATQARPAMPSATSSTTRLKLVIRRLPPGLTEDEFETSLGEDWKVGSGKVDWAVFKPGKVSKDPSKPSKPSRAYLNLTKQEYIGFLSDTVRNAKFNDAKASSKDYVLLGPPSVEYAPYPKIPHSKLRRDNRQGTIDQDPEFIEFLESLTNPVPKASTVDQRVGLDGKSKDKITTTPLVQFLKDKKANKAKEAAAVAAAATATPKAAKNARQSSKDTQSAVSAALDKKSPSKIAASTAQSPDKRSAQAIMVEKAARDATRVFNKQTATPNKSQGHAAAPATPVSAPTTPANTPLPERKRERGSASTAASILRRDLGIGTNPSSRGGRRGLPTGQSRPRSNSSAQATPTAPVQQKDAKATESATESTTTSQSPPATSSATATSTAPVASFQNSSTAQPPTEPAASRGSAKANTATTATSTPNAPSAPSKHIHVSPTATQAFLKHANPSQGITEPLLNEAFAKFGTVKRVEIDRKKGSAYVDFEEPEGLQKAIKASPIKVAQGQVVVLERRMVPHVAGRNARGGPMTINRGLPDPRGGMHNHRGIGGMANNRGGGGIPMGPMGGRGGSIRGRGGFVRGGGNAQNPRPAATATPQTAQGTDSDTPVTSTADAIVATSVEASPNDPAELQAPPPAAETTTDAGMEP
ncbi:MAG: hypothetical protein Q9172_002863 [Xanthocarpia lactea]